MSHFRIGIFAVPEPDMTNLEAVRYVHEIGLDAFEPFPQRDLKTLETAAAERIREEADRLGVTIPCFSVLANLTGEGREAEIARLKRCAEIAKIMGSPLLHHTLYPLLKPEDVRTPAELIDEAASAAREVYDYAETLGVKCVYEDQGLAFNGIEGFGLFLVALDRPAGVVLDLGNVAFAKEKPAPFAEKYLERIVHVHVKDYGVNRANPNYTLADGTTLSPAALGEGDLQIADALRILKNAGYSGWLMLENERLGGGRESQIDDVRILREMLSSL